MANIRLKQNEYNVGALSGKYALKNMANTGKFANIIESNPLKVSIEVDKINGIVTLKQGSLLTVPSGFSEMDDTTPVTHYERINDNASITLGHVLDDFTKEPSTDDKAYLVYNVDAGLLECDHNIVYEFIDKDIYENGEVKYEGNTFIRVSSKSKCALPLGYFDDAWHWHPFGGIGFYKSRMWVDSGVTYYVPDGRSDRYDLNIDIVTIESITYTNVTNLISGTSLDINATSGTLLLDTMGRGIITPGYKSSVSATSFQGYEYVTSENYIYNPIKEVAKVCKICDATIVNGNFSSLSNFNTYQQVDFTEMTGRLSDLDEKMLHNDGRTETVVGEFVFPHKATFNNIEVTGGNILGGTITGSLAVTGNLDLPDAYIQGVGSKAANPNCIAIVGKTNSARGGIAFGTGNSIKMVADENDKTITVTLPTDGAILPATSQINDIGTIAKKYRNVYAMNFYGTAQQSEWADLAEIYHTDNNYPIGTLLQFGGEKELTIAHTEVNAVVSEKPGVLMNSGSDGQPIALAGRVRVRVNGKVNKFDKIYLSHVDGIGSTNTGGNPIGRALEKKSTNGEGLVLCAVHFNI